SNGDGKLDIFAPVDNSGAGGFIRIFNPGTGANNSPSTTSIDAQNPLFSYAEAATNFDFEAVTAIIDPAVTNTAYPTPTNIGGVTGSGDLSDFFLYLFLPFSILFRFLTTLHLSVFITI